MAAAQDTPGLFARREDYGFQTDARELRAFFTAYEADVRFKSTFSAMLAAAAGVAIGAGPPASWDPYAEIIDRISRGTKVYRMLRRMDAAGQAAHVCVLFRLHGPRNGANERPEFGELAPLAAMTDAAEEARVELVLTESTRREERVGARVAQSQRDRRADLELLFWQEAVTLSRLEEEQARIEAELDPKRARAALLDEERAMLVIDGDGDPAKIAERLDRIRRRRDWHQRWLARAPERLRELERRIAAGRQLLGQILEGFSYDGTLRARLGAIAGADREITVEDAIRAKLDDPSVRKADRLVFVSEVKAQAQAMRTAAHAAYRLAKEHVDESDAGRRVVIDMPRSWRPTTVSYSVSGASP